MQVCIKVRQLLPMRWAIILVRCTMKKPVAKMEDLSCLKWLLVNQVLDTRMLMATFQKVFLPDSNPNNNNFSSCSIITMHQGIKNLTLEVYKVKDCFKPIKGTDTFPPVEISLCGNNIVEPGEMCDCGAKDFECNDNCCYPAHVR